MEQPRVPSTLPPDWTRRDRLELAMQLGASILASAYHTPKGCVLVVGHVPRPEERN